MPPKEGDRLLLSTREGESGTEIKVNFDMMVGLLRAAGGRLIIPTEDMDGRNCEIIQWERMEPHALVIELREIPEEPKELPPRRGAIGSTWTDPATGLMWRYHRDSDRDGWWRRTPPDNELVWWSGGFRE